MEWVDLWLQRLVDKSFARSPRPAQLKKPALGSILNASLAQSLRWLPHYSSCVVVSLGKTRVCFTSLVHVNVADSYRLVSRIDRRFFLLRGNSLEPSPSHSFLRRRGTFGDFTT